MGKLLEQRNRALDDINAGRTVKKIRDLESRMRELEEENARLKRTNSSYANLTKAKESQLTNLRQRLYQLKGADSAIDSERQANCELTEQLAAEQLNNKLLRDALEAVIKVHGYESGIPVEAVSTTASTEALDAYVAEKVKISRDIDEKQIAYLFEERSALIRKRKLAVAALEAIAGRRIFIDNLASNVDIAVMTLDAIKESEEN
jgi:predicted RNase H-like nuclease (RuvC/YqgF family)